MTDSGPGRAPPAPTVTHRAPWGRMADGDTMGIEDDTTARRLRLLQSDFIEPGRSGRAERCTRSTTPSAPVRLGIIDHIASRTKEIEEHTRAEAPGAGPAPANLPQIYTWCREQTAQVDPERQRARETLIYRQGLEHAVAMGDYDVVCRHPCPGCGCWGLFWDVEQRKAGCVNRYCLDGHGLSRTWSLQQLAFRHIDRQKMLKTNAT